MNNIPYAYSGYKIIVSESCPKDKVFIIGGSIVMATITPFFFKLYEFDEAVKKLAEYTLQNLYERIDRAFNYSAAEKFFMIPN